MDAPAPPEGNQQLDEDESKSWYVMFVVMGGVLKYWYILGGILNAADAFLDASLGPGNVDLPESLQYIAPLVAAWNGFADHSVFLVGVQGLLLQILSVAFVKFVSQSPVVPSFLQSYSVLFKYMIMCWIIPSGNPGSPERVINMLLLFACLYFNCLEALVTGTKEVLLISWGSSIFVLSLVILLHLEAVTLGCFIWMNVPTGFALTWQLELDVAYAAIPAVVQLLAIFGVFIKKTELRSAWVGSVEDVLSECVSAVTDGFCLLVTVYEHSNAVFFGSAQVQGLKLLAAILLRQKTLFTRVLCPLTTAGVLMWQWNVLKKLPLAKALNDICPICLDSLHDRSPVLSCGHTAHGGCLRKWLFNNPKCPLCNQSLNATRWHIYENCKSCSSGTVKTWCSICGEAVCGKCLVSGYEHTHLCPQCISTVERSPSIPREQSPALVSQLTQRRAPSIERADSVPR